MFNISQALISDSGQLDNDRLEDDREFVLIMRENALGECVLYDIPLILSGTPSRI
jgi:hypothetical protein